MLSGFEVAAFNGCTENFYKVKVELIELLRLLTQLAGLVAEPFAV